MINGLPAALRRITARAPRFQGSVLAGLLVFGGVLPHQSAVADQLQLAWVDTSDGEAAFSIERATGTGGAYVQLAAVGAGVTAYSDGTVASGTTYCYRVQAYNEAGASAYSNEACGSTATGLVLSVSRTGAGAGAVASSPGGISCGSDCSETYTSGTLVTLAATPASGSVFSGWSGGGCAGTDPCTLTGNTPVAVAATFTVVPVTAYPLTVSKTGSGVVTSGSAGISCGSDCWESYLAGTVVTLTATPGKGARFAGWSGGCSGTGLCSVTMNATKTVSAAFVNGRK